MKKIGIALFTLLALATSACAESPTASAAGAEASLSEHAGELVSYGEENPGLAGSDHFAGAEGETLTTAEVARGPGLAGSGH